MVISYPDVYEVGMCNLGLRILYESVNRVKEFSCERVFAPWPDFEQKLRENKIPLYSLETYTPLKEFDVVGFSMGYELLCTNLLTIIELGNIPLFSRERTEDDPLIIAGGPAVVNPEPLADFVDVFIIGDGELALVQFLCELVKLKERTRREKLTGVNALDFTYVPSLYGTKVSRGYMYTEVDKPVKRRIEPDLDRLPYPTKPLVPLMRTIQDKLSIEVNRGCINGCRFCQAGFIYRPLRERSVRKIVDIIETSIDNSGYDEISLASLSIGDFSQLHELVSVINRYLDHQRVSISLPSLRVNSTNLDLLESVQEVRKSGLTFAIESADEGVRKRLNKSVDESQLEDIITRIVRLGWRLVKLYFMIGLPMSQHEGEKIREFLLRLKKVSSRLSINVNISPYVPKPHTPFERERQIGVEEAWRTIHEIRKAFFRTRVKVKYHDPRMSLIEGILSRGDRKICGLVYDVYKKGERFSSWDEGFNYNLWISSIEERALHIDRYLELKEAPERLPWDFICSGVDKGFLKQEETKAEKGETTHNCVYYSCSSCGVCKGRIKNKRAGAFSHDEILQGLTKRHPSIFLKRSSAKENHNRCKVIFVFKKLGLFRFIPHLDLMNLFVRIVKRTALPIRYSEGFNPKPRLMIPFPLPIGIESDYEIGEIFFDDFINPKDFIGLCNEKLEDSTIEGSITIERAEIASDRKSIGARPCFHDYEFALEGAGGYDFVSSEAGIARRNEFEDTPFEHYTVKESRAFIRLEGKRSIKTVFRGDTTSYLSYSIRRTMIWELREGRLGPFL